MPLAAGTLRGRYEFRSCQAMCLLALSASEQSSSPFQISLLSGRRGSKDHQRPNDYRGVGVAADSRGLVTVQSELLSKIWIAPHNDAGLARQITSGRSDGQEWVSLTPDGRIVYASRAGGKSDLWVTDADGSNQKELTTTDRRRWRMASGLLER